MSDYTVSGRHGGSGMTKKLEQDCLFDDDKKCLYCNHALDLHGIEPLQAYKVKPAGTVIGKDGEPVRLVALSERRTTFGINVMWCHVCASEMETNQVVCYKVPAKMKELVKASGKWRLSNAA